MPRRRRGRAPLSAGLMSGHEAALGSACTSRTQSSVDAAGPRRRLVSSALQRLIFDAPVVVPAPVARRLSRLRALVSLELPRGRRCRAAHRLGAWSLRRERASRGAGSARPVQVPRRSFSPKRRRHPRLRRLTAGRGEPLDAHPDASGGRKRRLETMRTGPETASRSNARRGAWMGQASADFRVQSTRRERRGRGRRRERHVRMGPGMVRQKIRVGISRRHAKLRRWSSRRMVRMDTHHRRLSIHPSAALWISRRRVSPSRIRCVSRRRVTKRNGSPAAQGKGTLRRERAHRMVRAFALHHAPCLSTLAGRCGRQRSSISHFAWGVRRLPLRAVVRVRAALGAVQLHAVHLLRTRLA